MLRNVGYSLAVLAVAGAAYLAGSWRAPRETLSAAAPASTRPILYYHCPMHPDYRSDRPGTAPCCGMDVEPVYAGGDAAVPDATGAIAVSPAQQQLIGVTTGVVEEVSGTERVRLFGRVTPDEARVFRLTAGVDAYVSDISGVTTGSVVAKNQWLATFSTPDVRVPISAFITAANVLEREERNGREDPVALAAAQVSVGLAIDRLMTLGMSREQIEEIRRTRAATSAVRVAAPADGFVMARRVSAGQRFDAGAELYQLADLRRVWILADLHADDRDLVRPGLAAEISVGGRPLAVGARVSDTAPPRFDPDTQRFELRLEADNPGFVLRPDMFVDVDLEIRYPPTLLVAADAVVISGLHTHVFVERSPGVFEPREVKTGRRYADRIGIVSGLERGDRIATAGAFLLDSESRMKGHDRQDH